MSHFNGISRPLFKETLLPVFSGSVLLINLEQKIKDQDSVLHSIETLSSYKGSAITPKHLSQLGHEHIAYSKVPPAGFWPVSKAIFGAENSFSHSGQIVILIISDRCVYHLLFLYETLRLSDL
jgi:hypothetical protein